MRRNAGSFPLLLAGLRLAGGELVVARPTHRKGAMNGAQGVVGREVCADQRKDF